MTLRAARRRVTRWIGRAADREVAAEAERVVARAAVRARLAAVEAEIVGLMADDRVAACGRRLVALERARVDLRAELEETEVAPAIRRRERGIG